MGIATPNKLVVEHRLGDDRYGNNLQPIRAEASDTIVKQSNRIIASAGRRAVAPGISEACNPRARTMMIEAAWRWLRYQPDSALARWLRERVGYQQGRMRRIEIVALARKLAVVLG